MSEGGSKDREGGGDEEEDFFNTAIQRSGCAKEHYTLQDCYSNKGDWRECKKEMAQFRTCMDQQRKMKDKS